MKEREVLRKPKGFLLREDLHEQLKAYCKDRGLVLYRVVEDIIEDFLADKNVKCARENKLL